MSGPRPSALAAIGLAIFVLAPLRAGAVTFDVDFTQSLTYQVQSGDTYADLVLEHQSGPLLASVTLTGIEGISAPVYAGGVNQNYSIWMRTVLDISVTGIYEFQVGTDWGRGGASVVIDNGSGAIVDEFVTTDDIWWANDWNNPDVFTTTVQLDAGESYTLGWVGFEGCCGGMATVRFSFEGAPFQNLNELNVNPFISNPEPGTGLLVAFGLVLLARGGRRRRACANC